jgi:hypothetical protein
VKSKLTVNRTQFKYASDIIRQHGQQLSGVKPVLCGVHGSEFIVGSSKLGKRVLPAKQSRVAGKVLYLSRISLSYFKLSTRLVTLSLLKVNANMLNRVNE